MTSIPHEEFEWQVTWKATPKDAFPLFKYRVSLYRPTQSTEYDKPVWQKDVVSLKRGLARANRAAKRFSKRKLEQVAKEKRLEQEVEERRLKNQALKGSDRITVRVKAN